MRRYTPAGHLIRKARLEAGMTQAQLAAEVGVAAGRVSDYECGKLDPTVDTFLKLLAATEHTIALVDAVDTTFANPHLNARRLIDVLDLADAMIEGVERMSMDGA